MDETLGSQSQAQESTGPVQGTLFELENLALSHQGSIEAIIDQKRKLEHELQDALENDAVYHEKSVSTSQVAKELAVTKEQVLKQPHLVELQQKVKSLREEIKDKKAAISDYALEIVRMAGINQIEKDGEVYDIVTTAKLVKAAKPMQQ